MAVLSDIDTIERPVLVSVFPSSTIHPLYVTMTPILSNITWHPALHSTTADIRDPADIPARLCLVRTTWGNCGRSNSRVWVEVSCYPSGIVTVIGSCVGLTYVADVSITRAQLGAPDLRSITTLCLQY